MRDKLLDNGPVDLFLTRERSGIMQTHQTGSGICEMMIQSIVFCTVPIFPLAYCSTPVGLLLHSDHPPVSSKHRGLPYWYCVRPAVWQYLLYAQRSNNMPLSNMGDTPMLK
ncbi:hypothetical protein HRR83_007188 [Exophiala dermatitidis]|uniref:Uncharacterized protein n=1 Tax=Exophiala dermatitidis TaxID=5970 RepID=A0AAN6EQ44_EXODE|nr:hypothetical protein HRR73_006480 [Exophiala dermatitidis]KAJ4511918.1 hypothetical protein HRR74_006652 [Exophiala dermatitidis]KAJ4534779.1 hypothetical protein HRR76_006688 [Exophiala dermatitidis]KAJ4550871.1 hypothetical protein HRR77_003229 [Exophiala dermatitidis]KAJ4562004.1 hypothetical protein HRR79_006867 [Exophiala dermatitidis]